MYSRVLKPYNDEDSKRKQDKNKKEKERRDRENEIVDELRDFLLKSQGNIKHSKLEKCDVLRETLSYCNMSKQALEQSQLMVLLRDLELNQLKARIYIMEKAIAQGNTQTKEEPPRTPSPQKLLDVVNSPDSGLGSPASPNTSTSSGTPRIWRPFPK